MTKAVMDPCGVALTLRGRVASVGCDVLLDERLRLAILRRLLVYRRSGDDAPGSIGVDDWNRVLELCGR